MGRPMRPIDPADGTIQAFAAELRQLRERAGSPPFRVMARRAHYSATTLSVACAGASLPSLDVTLAFVRVCDGPAGYWRGRWQEAADAQADGTGRAGPAAGDAHDRPAVRRLRDATTRLRRPIALAAVIAIASAAGAAAWSLGHPVASKQPGRAAARELYVGVSPCDVGAVILSQANVTLPAPLRLGGRNYPAGTVVGVVALRFSPRCALAWTRFLPAAPFGRAHAGTVTLQSRRAADGAISTVMLSPVVAAEGDPLLTVPGCVLAQATVRFGAGQPAATATTGCYP
jgi:hypothetical protein